MCANYAFRDHSAPQLDVWVHNRNKDNSPKSLPVYKFIPVNHDYWYIAQTLFWTSYLLWLAVRAGGVAVQTGALLHIMNMHERELLLTAPPYTLITLRRERENQPTAFSQPQNTHKQNKHPHPVHVQVVSALVLPVEVERFAQE